MGHEDEQKMSVLILNTVTQATSWLRLSWILGLVLITPGVVSAQSPEALAVHLRGLEPNVLSEQQKRQTVGMVQRDIQRRRNAANAQDRSEWKAITSRADWEAYRDERLRRLKMSLGTFPERVERLNWHVTGVIKGAGFQIENIVYENRPGNWVPGNLYVPAIVSDSMPGLLIVHSHHRDKTHGELQDMGMTWARAGCLVLVIDQVGYGERRAHPFDSQGDYSGDFKSWRQDYYYRYDSGIQLRLAGDSLMGWFVWDLMRGVDLLLAREGADPQRIVILGSVAGGGDPCAVTAALDKRIAGAVPFNFGGLQPESYPLPENAEETFNFAMSSYWDSTRGLPGTCSDGFFHWTIVGGIAPRPLIYAHEFMWDRQRDPVWRRFQRIYDGFYGERAKLAFAVGKGSVRDSSDIASHCTHIGRYHRQFIHPAFARWFDIQVGVDGEYSNHVDRSALLCMTSEFRERFAPQGFVKLVSELGESRVASASQRLRTQSVESQRTTLRRELSELLGPVEPARARVLASTTDAQDAQLMPSMSVRRLLLETEEGISVPLLMLSPNSNSASPVVIAIAQAGKEVFLAQRSETIARLIQAGVTVCLPDVRGTGETLEGSSRGRTSGDVGRSVNMQMFGETILGQRLRDLRSVLSYLRDRKDLDGTKVAIWGDAFVPPNPADTDFNVPHDVTREARKPEPLGGLLALLLALYEDDIHAVYIHQGLASYLSVLQVPHVYIPHDAVLPQALNVGDLSDLAAAISPTRLRLSAMVDALNRSMTDEQLRRTYRSLPPGQLALTQIGGSGDPAAWIIESLKQPVGSNDSGVELRPQR